MVPTAGGLLPLVVPFMSMEYPPLDAFQTLDFTQSTLLSDPPTVQPLIMIEPLGRVMNVVLPCPGSSKLPAPTP